MECRPRATLATLVRRHPDAATLRCPANEGAGHANAGSFCRSAINNLRREVRKWADRTKADLHEASMNSVGANLKQIRGIVEKRKQITAGMIPDNRRLLR